MREGEITTIKVCVPVLSFCTDAESSQVHFQSCRLPFFLEFSIDYSPDFSNGT